MARKRPLRPLERLRAVPLVTKNFEPLFSGSAPTPVDELSFVPIPRLGIEIPGAAECSDNPDALNFAAAMLSLSPNEVRDFVNKGSVGNPIPQFVTADTIGDATGYTDPKRVFAIGYEGDWPSEEWPREWSSRALPELCITRQRGDGSFEIEVVAHLLGASYLLDFGVNASVNPWRMQYTGPRTGGHRGRVEWSGSGDFYIRDDCEGWDAVIAHGTYDETALVVGKWRGSRRVWFGFGIGNASFYEWSGLAGFQGEIAKLAARQLFTGDIPARVLFEMLCETCRLPLPLVGIARRCGFNPERN